MQLDKAILALRHVASSDETRVNLSGIYLTASEACATSGYALATVKHLEAPEARPEVDGGEPELKPCILGKEDAAAIEKAIPKARHRALAVLPELDTAAANANGHLTVTIGATVMNPPKVEGEFPDYSTVLPKGEPTFRVGFNVGLLNDLLKVAKAAGDGDRLSEVLVLEFYGELTGKAVEKGYAQAIGVRAPSAPRFAGLLMPFRVDS